MRILLDMKYENVELISEEIEGWVDFRIIDGHRAGEVSKIKQKDLDKIAKWESEGVY